jgi:hypothetical protein
MSPSPVLQFASSTVPVLPFLTPESAETVPPPHHSQRVYSTRALRAQRFVQARWCAVVQLSPMLLLCDYKRQATTGATKRNAFCCERWLAMELPFVKRTGWAFDWHGNQSRSQCQAGWFEQPSSPVCSPLSLGRCARVNVKPGKRAVAAAATVTAAIKQNDGVATVTPHRKRRADGLALLSLQAARAPAARVAGVLLSSSVAALIAAPSDASRQQKRKQSFQSTAAAGTSVPDASWTSRLASALRLHSPSASPKCRRQAKRASPLMLSSASSSIAAH